MKGNYWLKEFLLLQCIALAVSESYYTIIAPGLMKPNRKYSAVVALHEAEGPCVIRVGLEGPNFNRTHDVELQPFESKLIEFFPKGLLDGTYKLTAEGLSGINFKNESQIIYYNRYYGPKIYIQTDKGIYKPEDLIRFRIAILDEHTRPLYIDDPIRVEILDGYENSVKQIRNITLTKGVYNGHYQLPKYPPFGRWTIKVALGGNYDFSETKTIKVRKYELPKFSVFIKAPVDVVLDDGSVRVAFYGKYTFNKYVEGNASVQLYYLDENKPLMKKELYVDRLTSFEFKLEDLKGISNLKGISVLVKLTEKNTGKTERGVHSMRLHRQRYNIEILQDEIDYKNNKPYRLKSAVKHLTGAAVLDYKTPVTMTHGDKVYESFLDQNGEAIFEFDHQAEANHVFQFKDSKSIFPNIYASQSLQLYNKKLGLRVANEKTRLGKPLQIEVTSTDVIPYLEYILMGHANLIRSEHVKVPSNQTSHIIEIMPSIEMVPKSFIYVYYIENGDLRYEEMTLNLPNELENQISIEAPKQVIPGADVTLTINAQPDSYVSILAVDLGVYILDSSYDLYKKDILNDLAEEKSYSVVPPGTYPGILSGVITLTNANFQHSAFAVFPTYPPPVSFPPRFRQNFPETWLFNDYFINDTTTQLTLPVPDTTTTWRITAFSNNDVTGFGIVNGPKDVVALQPLFISVNLPYSVKRGEIISIPVTIFNYLNQTVDVEVVLYNNDREFSFMESKPQGVEKSNDDQQQIKQIEVPVNKAETVNFLIYPTRVGEINLRISATSDLYSDAILEKLKVEPEGIPKQKHQSMYLSIPSGERIASDFNIDIPEDKISDSDYITLSVGGHYLVPTIENFDDLIQMPTGCGEQNVLNFAPAVLLLEYLKANGKLSKEDKLVKNLISAIETGYQQQLSFRHWNGGFSVFGEKTDDETSTWLTAYVVRYLIKATKYTDIESKIIESGLKYLQQQQNSNGEFPYTGYLLNQNHMDPYGLTAFVLLAFLEDNNYAEMYKEVIENGIEFLNTNMESINDVYALAIVATVFKRVRHNNDGTVINQLKTYAREEKGLKWWSGNDVNPSNDIEVTAYAAMCLLETPGDHTPILKWLIEQRNANGGFSSSHDTVVGMEALVKFSEKYKDFKNINLRLSYKALDEGKNEIQTGEFTVDSNNIYVFQGEELPPSTRYVSFDMEGNGNCLVQVKHQYHSMDTNEHRHFEIKPKVMFNNSEEITLEICFTYRPELTEFNATNMVIMEVNLPSGYTSQAESNENLKNNKLVEKIETKNSESVVIVYLDNLKANVNLCLNIPADKSNEILASKPAAIIMYDYYNPNRTNTVFYSFK